MGIITKNSILLIEYAVVGIHERGLSMHDALLDAYHKRARPIVMTSVAMVAGMPPIALRMCAEASFRQPIATAVIGGMITSTALSLLVVLWFSPMWMASSAAYVGGSGESPLSSRPFR